MKQHNFLFIFLLIIFISISTYWSVCYKKENLLNIKKETTYHIVIAKYREDVSWFFHMDLDKLYIYDKSGNEHTPFIPLENRGREGATFLGHIINHYDDFPDYLILLQGDPFPHMRPEINPKNLQENITKLIQQNPKTQPLFCDWFEEPLYLHPGLIMDKYYNLIFEGKIKDPIKYASGNQFLVARRDILKRPKKFYQKLLKMAIKGDHYNANQAHFDKNRLDPTEIMGWSLERIFPIILSDVPIKKSFLID